MSYIYPQKIAEVNGAVVFLREQGADIAASAVEALVQHLSLIERELEEYVTAAQIFSIEKAELRREKERLIHLVSSPPAGSWAWLRNAICTTPTRIELLGGQKTRYVQMDEVLGLIDERERTEADIHELQHDAARYQWLRTRAGQIGAILWRHAPWIHEDHTENQARFELCIDEERLDAIDAVSNGKDK